MPPTTPPAIAPALGFDVLFELAFVGVIGAVVGSLEDGFCDAVDPVEVGDEPVVDSKGSVPANMGDVRNIADNTRKA